MKKIWLPLVLALLRPLLALGLPKSITNSLGMKLVLVPAGEFKMGADEPKADTMRAFPFFDPSILDREWPSHKVRITKPFYMGAYEVTLDQFRKFVYEAHYKVD